MVSSQHVSRHFSTHRYNIKRWLRKQQYFLIITQSCYKVDADRVLNSVPCVLLLLLLFGVTKKHFWEHWLFCTLCADHVHMGKVQHFYRALPEVKCALLAWLGFTNCLLDCSYKYAGCSRPTPDFVLHYNSGQHTGLSSNRPAIHLLYIKLQIISMP